MLLCNCKPPAVLNRIFGIGQAQRRDGPLPPKSSEKLLKKMLQFRTQIRTCTLINTLRRLTQLITFTELLTEVLLSTDQQRASD